MSNVDYINFWCDQCEDDTGLVCTGKGAQQCLKYRAYISPVNSPVSYLALHQLVDAGE